MRPLFFIPLSALFFLLIGCNSTTITPSPSPSPTLQATAVNKSINTLIATALPTLPPTALSTPTVATLSPTATNTAPPVVTKTPVPTLEAPTATKVILPTPPATTATKLAVPTMPPAPTSSAPAIAISDIAGVQSFSGLGQNHVPFPVNYPMRPPVGGDHVSVWQNCGIYEEPVIDEQAVHSMEHGAVWIAYQPSLALPAVQKLRSYARGNAYVLMSPYPGLSHAVAITAWGLQLRLTDVNDPRIALFVSKHANGPQTPEKGARCSGGVGSPVER